MFFTQEDYRKIQEWLKRNSIKDTEFQEANTPLSGNEIITIVQGGKNKRFFLKDLVDQIVSLDALDFTNVSELTNTYNISIAEAIKLVPAKARKKGQVITFTNTEGNWEIYQFAGALNQWDSLDLWENLLDIKDNSILKSKLAPEVIEVLDNPITDAGVLIDNSVGIPEAAIEVKDKKLFLSLKNIKGEKGEKGDKGDKGEKGDKGDADASVRGYIHYQETEAKVWNVSHNLGQVPVVMLYNELKEAFLADVTYADENNSKVSMNFPTKGFAVCLI